MKVGIHCCLSGYDASPPSVSSHIPVSVGSPSAVWSGCFIHVRCYGGLSVVLLQVNNLGTLSEEKGISSLFRVSFSSIPSLLPSYVGMVCHF